MSTGLQRAYAATHGLELGATYQRGAETRTLTAVELTPAGTSMARYTLAGRYTCKCRLATFAKWAKAGDRVAPAPRPEQAGRAP